jgi:hypothetical protein
MTNATNDPLAAAIEERLKLERQPQDRIFTQFAAHVGTLLAEQRVDAVAAHDQLCEVIAGFRREMRAEVAALKGGSPGSARTKLVATKLAAPVRLLR